MRLSFSILGTEVFAISTATTEEIRGAPDVLSGPVPFGFTAYDKYAEHPEETP